MRGWRKETGGGRDRETERRRGWRKETKRRGRQRDREDKGVDERRKHKHR